ncbi:hypothetical protein HK100_000956 [Physocladia obscura]|uniref:Uncharacterized protein n=1 Tax=Physocladia obscura TaxID=109957 RepID=A0AAD5T955_9FUNG|nr:hypothetical protein HK100_000956 [Physocladia obscura]
MITNNFTVTELAKMNELQEDKYAIRLDTIKSKVCATLIQIVQISVILDINDQPFEPPDFSLKQTNNSTPTPKELSEKLFRLGLDVEPSHFYTSAIATAKFLKSQKPEGGSVYVLGGPGLTFALYEHGFTMSEHKPDFVVIGTEGSTHNFESLQKALSLITKDGAKLIGTNPDSNGVKEDGECVLGTGAFIAALEVASGKKAFTCGKPSSLMMSYAQEFLGIEKKDIAIIGDRMDTDILAGTNAQIDPVLVMSGVTNLGNLYNDAYRPYLILNGVGELV